LQKNWSLLTTLKKKPECVTHAELSGDDYAALFQKQMAIITEEEMEEHFPVDLVKLIYSTN
jgi:hypothetical protein